MEKYNDSNDRAKRGRNQAEGTNEWNPSSQGRRNWDLQSEDTRDSQASSNRNSESGRDRDPDFGPYENKRSSGLSPNYDSNYRPGDYSQYSNRNRENRGGNPGYREETRDRNSNDSRMRNGNWNEQTEPVNYGRDDRSYPYPEDYNQRNRASDKDWNRFGSPSYERGEFNDDPGLRANYNGANAQNNRQSFPRYSDGAWRNEDSPFGIEGNEYGQHRGKGPKGYSRSDERIKEDVSEKLTDDGHLDASNIELDVRNGEVILKGTVRTRQEKRRAEDIIDRVSGVKNVENHLKVEEPSSGLGKDTYTNGLRERNSNIQYGPGAVSGMGNTAATGDFNTAK